MNDKIVFLHDNLKEDIYMTQLDGLKVASNEDIVWNLKKSLYSLKQSARQEHKKIDQVTINYTISYFDKCVYFKNLKVKFFDYLLLYVDDISIVSKSTVEIEKLKAQQRANLR